MSLEVGLLLEIDQGRLSIGSSGASLRVSPSWILPGASLDFDFTTARYWQEAVGEGSTATTYLTTSRASTGYVQSSNGIWTSIGSNLPRISDQGLLVEEARTNDALWSRDMTNVVWVKVNMTAALTATGIDGAVNSASTLTATAGNATILQTITLTSQADTYSVWLKRVSGTGTINITENGGTAYTAVTLTSTWTQFQVTATLANPVFGVQIVTSGDVIAADFNQLEPGGFATSPILTTSATVTRATDNIIVAAPPAFGTAYTAYAKGVSNSPSANATTRIILGLYDGTASNRFEMRQDPPGLGLLSTARGGVVGGITSAGTWLQGQLGSIACAISSSNDTEGWCNGTKMGGSASFPIGVNEIALGSRLGTIAPFNGYIIRAAVFLSRSSTSMLNLLSNT